MEEVKETLLKVQEAVANVQGRGAIIEPTLCWIESKKENGLTNTELLEMMETVVEASEIHLAKEALSEFIKEKRPVQMQDKRFQGQVISRKGNKKTESEKYDILKMMEWLDEAGAMPILVMTSNKINKMPKKDQIEEANIGTRLGRMEELLKAMDKKVETYNSELKREIYGIKPSYANLARELNVGVQSGQVPSVVQPAGGVVHGVPATGVGVPGIGPLTDQTPHPGGAPGEHSGQGGGLAPPQVLGGGGPPQQGDGGPHQQGGGGQHHQQGGGGPPLYQQQGGGGPPLHQHHNQQGGGSHPPRQLPQQHHQQQQ